MKKNKKILISIFILSSCISVCGGYKYKVYSLTKENIIDLLINNQEKQKILHEEINDLEEDIKIKKDTLNGIGNESNSDSNIVTVSFIKEEDLLDEEKITQEDLIKDEIFSLTNEKEEYEKELENYMTEGVKLEKYLEEEKRIYLEKNNLEYIPGIWPLESYTTISSQFGNRIHPISGVYKFHKGIDIPAPENTDILASDDGIVMFSGTKNGYGNVVKIKHFDGKETLYAHSIYNLVKSGDIVRKGQVVSKVGSTGNSTGNHLHFETIVKGKIINPLVVVSK